MAPKKKSHNHSRNQHQVPGRKKMSDTIKMAFLVLQEELNNEICLHGIKDFTLPVEYTTRSDDAVGREKMSETIKRTFLVLQEELSNAICMEGIRNFTLSIDYKSGFNTNKQSNARCKVKVHSDGGAKISKIHSDYNTSSDKVPRIRDTNKDKVQSEGYTYNAKGHSEIDTNNAKVQSEGYTYNAKGHSEIDTNNAEIQSEGYTYNAKGHSEIDTNSAKGHSEIDINNHVIHCDNKETDIGIKLLKRRMSSLMDEIRYQCTIIRDFDLPFSYLQDNIKDNEMDNHSINTDMLNAKCMKTTPKRRRSKRTNTKASRQKDKERKRKQRMEQKRNVASQPAILFLHHDVSNKKKSYFQLRYKHDVAYREAKKRLNRRKYMTNPVFQCDMKRKSRKKYASNLEFQESVKKRYKQKYANNPEFQESVKNRYKQKYANDPEFQESVKNRKKQKYANDPEFRDKVKDRSKTRYTNDPKYKASARERIRRKYESDHNYQEKLRKLSLLRYRDNILLREKYKRRLKQQYHHEISVRQRKIAVVQKRRLAQKNHTRNLSGISNWFKERIKDGPTFVCSVCIKFKFRKQVIECKKDNYSKKGTKNKEMADKCISNQFCKPCNCGNYCEDNTHKLWICHTCNNHLLKGSMPADAYVNGLQLKPIPNCLKSLNKLEKQLIALRIPFIKLVNLPKGSQKGVVGPCVSVPTDVEKTTNILPRFDDEAQLVRCKLKRKLVYKGHSEYEFISPKKIRESLQTLKIQNELYYNTSLNFNWENSMTNIIEDENDTTKAEAENNDDNDTAETEPENNDDNEEEDQNVLDRGLPSDTCLQPVDIGQEILDQHFDDIFCIAPGEGKTPVSMMQEFGNEAMSFPVQFPEGVFGSYDSARQQKMTRSKYFHARLLSADNRFSTDTSYLFYAQYLSELEQVLSKVSIAMRKSSGKDTAGNVLTANMLTDRDQLKKLLTTDQGYKFLTPIRGTPPYWQAALRDLMAMIRQLGIPTWFATFSAADLRWTEILEILLGNQNSQQTVEDLDWTGKAELIKNNPVMNAVLFNHRFTTFLKEIIIKKQIIGKVKDHFHRIEFQQRGSPHAHCLFWVEDAPMFEKDDDQTICDFIDRYVSCELPDETTDTELYNIVSSVQQHSKNHAKTCKKKGTTCRFNFPRPPSERTFISQSQSLTDPTSELSPQQMVDNAKIVLSRLWNILEDRSVEHLTTQNLFIAAGITQKKFEEASNILTKRINIVLKRKPSDVWINQYNPDLLRCWNANMDIQYITDPYSCVMYIISYISKAEREMGMVLENARKEAAEGNSDAQDAMKKIGSAYFRQREVSAQEAAYRVCGLHLKESSRKVHFLPCGENQVKMSLPLNVIKMKGEQLEDQNLWMVSLYDRYKARPVGDEFESICYAAFCSEFYSLSPSQVPKNPAKAANVYQLQNDLGYIKKRSRTDSAVVRYPRFSSKKKPLLHFHVGLQLFLPHRTENQLKPDQFQTFEEMYVNGTIVLPPNTEPQHVASIVETNRQKFEKNANDLDEAQEMIDIQGPLEDAWALIAPESEAERLEGQELRETLTEEDSVEIPELDSSNKRTKQGADIEIRQALFSSSEMQKCMRQLNEEQKAVFYRIRQWCLDKVNGENPEPLRIFISGGAGTGKSHLIKCLYFESNRILSPAAPNPDEIVVLLTAPTATAAFNIGGTTLHQAFSLTKALPLPYIYKRDDELNKLRCKFQNLNILVIDEISMVGQRVLIYLSERLRQIKQSGNAVFGNVCVVAVGDFYQLPPVRQKWLYDLRPQNYFPLWSANFVLVELKQIMRQKDDAAFAQLLNRLRVKKKEDSLLPEDLKMLERCSNQTAPTETLHIFGTNKEVDSHNSDMINTVCEMTETIEALDFDKDVQSGKLTLREVPYDTGHDYLPSRLTVGPKARVMLIRNLDVSCGLVNGALGTVTKILPKKAGSSLPEGVLVLFDNEKIIDPEQSSRRKEHLPVKITTTEENLQNNAIRHQFPLKLAWACTTHKVQGITVNKAVVSMKHIFSAGMAYVAMSRVTSMDGLVIKDFKEEKIYCNELISNSLQQMPRLLLPDGIDLQSNQKDATIILHNIQGINSHLEDLRANSDVTNADIICLTETWLGAQSATPYMEGYNFLQKTRFMAYSTKTDLFKDLKHKKHGGVGIFVGNDQDYNQLTLDNVNMECLAMHLKHINTNIVLVYKPEAFTTSVFLEELHKVLSTLPQDCYSIVFGDFNQDILKSNSSIQNYMTQHGYKQVVQKPTTDGGTLIDHIYVNGSLDLSIEIKQTYYSYHNLLLLKIKFVNK